MIEKEKDKERFLVGRDGDHLMNPFQCELCHFRNIQGRNPNPHSKADQDFLEHFRRVSLDVFWSREESTVRHNLGTIKRVALSEQKFDCVNKMIPALGPHPLEDTPGMAACVAVLDKSMDKGRYDDQVQWETFRKTRSSLTNVGQVGVGGLADAIGVNGKNKTWVSGADTHKFFFHRFMTGIHKRVGEEVRRDEPISIEVLKEVHRILDKRWKAEAKRRRPSQKKLKRIALAGYWFVVGFCSGLRGEEC